MPWSRSDRIGCASLIVGIAGVIAAWLTVPGIGSLRLPTTTTADTTQAPPPPQPSTTRSISHDFAFELVGCVFTSTHLVCVVDVTNLLDEERKLAVICGGWTSLVDSSGVAYSADRCYLGRDEAILYTARETLAPNVAYSMKVTFKYVRQPQTEMRYLELAVRDETSMFSTPNFKVGFRDIAVYQRK